MLYVPCLSKTGLLNGLGVRDRELWLIRIHALALLAGLVKSQASAIHQAYLVPLRRIQDTPGSSTYSTVRNALKFLTRNNVQLHFSSPSDAIKIPPIPSQRAVDMSTIS